MPLSPQLAMEPRQIISPQGQRQIGIGVPQKRLRLMFQSFASFSQLPNRFSPTDFGTQLMVALAEVSASRLSATLTYQASIAR